MTVYEINELILKRWGNMRVSLTLTANDRLASRYYISILTVSAFIEFNISLEHGISLVRKLAITQISKK